jgi:hypothetical protein
MRPLFSMRLLLNFCVAVVGMAKFVPAGSPELLAAEQERLGADQWQCATASSLSAISGHAFRHSLSGEAQGQWLRLEDVRFGKLLELSTCDEGVGDAELIVLQGSCEDPVEVLRGKLRCASGQTALRLLFDMAQPGPLYLLVHSVAADAVRAEYSRHPAFELQPPYVFEEVWLGPAPTAAHL